jgi:4-hydroxybenzoyl-CoA thioesterase
MSYHRDIAVEFNHCDPAGIVFYPRYFEMTNSVVENFFAEMLEYPFARIVAQGHGVPTVHLRADFRAPSRLGEALAFTLEVRRLGRSSVDFRIRAAAGGETRLSADLTLVWIGPQGRPEAWPAPLRRRLNDHLPTEETTP